jgi:ABC-type nitrate/sulfonate/bicarbonate transport system permease component
MGSWGITEMGTRHAFRGKQILLCLRPWALPVLLLALLEWAARILAPGSDAVAPPSQALLAFGRALMVSSEEGVLRASLFTLSSAAMGMLIGLVLGVGLGTVLGLSRRAASMGFLTIEVLRPIPSVALIPLAMMVFGFGFRLEVSVVAFATFWPLLILTQAAARQVEPVLIEVALALELSPWSRMTKVVLPAMAARLLVALRLGVAIALVVAVTVEVAANPYGMGYALMIAQQSLAPDLMLAWLAWIGVVGYGVNVLMLRFQRVLAHRMGEIPQEGRA